MSEPDSSARPTGRASHRGGAPTETHAARPSLEPLTRAGDMLQSYARYQRAMLPGFVPGAQPPAADPQARQSAKRHLALASRHMAAGRVGEAIAALRTAVRLVPDNAGAHNNLGLALLQADRLAEAIASLRQATLLQPDLGLAHYNLGVALNRYGLYEQSIESLRAAVGLKTKVREAGAALGDLLYSRGDFAEAAACYRRAADNSVAGRINAAKALTADGDYEGAAVALRRLIAREPGNVTALWTLGYTLMFMGRFEEALPHLEKACALAPLAVGPFYNLVTSKRMTAADRPLLARMAAALESGRVSGAARITAHYGLGKGLDDLRDYEAAMRHFIAANEIEKEVSAPYSREQAAVQADIQIARFTPDFFRKHAALGASDETPLFILGMPRSGTTLVEQILSNHPQVAAGDEMPFWLNRAVEWERSAPDNVIPAAIAGLAGDYRAELRRISPDAVRVTNKMPHNFQWIGLIHLVFPSARIIHCRRHPVDTCLSIYFTHFRIPMALANDRADLAFEYRRYLRLMEHWRGVLPPDRFLEVDYETLVADGEAQTRRLVEFCGLAWNDACLRPEDNRRIVATASLWQARQPVYRSSVARWRRYEPWLGELRELLPRDDRTPGMS